MNIIVAAGEPYHMGRLENPRRYRFGGLWVEYEPGNKFTLGLPGRDYPAVDIDEADVTDTIKFMLHHFKPCFPQSIRPADSIGEKVGHAIAALQEGQQVKCQDLLLSIQRLLAGE